MYQCVLVIQYAGICVLLFEMLYIMRRGLTRAQSYLALVTITALINNVGYLFEVTATTLEAAIIGTKVCYVGKAYIPLATLVFCMHYCKMAMPRWMGTLLAFFHTTVMLLVMSNDSHHLYYTSIGYTTEADFSHLVLGHGVIYWIYMAIQVVYLIVMTVICLSYYKKCNSKYEKKHLRYILLMLLIMGASFAAVMLKLTKGYDITSLGYVISSALLLLSIFKDNLFDTLNIAKDYAIDNLSDGLVVLGKNEEVMYFNAVVASVFGNVSNNEARAVVKEVMQKYADNEKIYANDKVYSINKRDIMHEDEFCGVMYILTDITDAYNYTERLEKEVEAKAKEIRHIQHSVIASFANMVEARDGTTGLHIKNTSNYVKLIVDELVKLPEYENLITKEDAEIMVEAAPLHDIGKITVPDYILTKPGKLTSEEFEVIKKHSDAGALIIDETLTEVEKNEYLVMARDMARFHHEKWDGSGYPCGLKGDDIPLCARVMAIADVYDALRSKRSYKEGFSMEKSIEIMRESSGTHFDPKLLEVFLANISRIDNKSEV